MSIEITLFETLWQLNDEDKEHLVAVDREKSVSEKWANATREPIVPGYLYDSIMIAVRVKLIERN